MSRSENYNGLVDGQLDLSDSNMLAGAGQGCTDGDDNAEEFESFNGRWADYVSPLQTVDILDVDSLELDDEDSWLYKSSNISCQLNGGEGGRQDESRSIADPYAWLREEFDQLSTGVVSEKLTNSAVKRSLLEKLESSDIGFDFNDGVSLSRQRCTSPSAPTNLTLSLPNDIDEDVVSTQPILFESFTRTDHSAVVSNNKIISSENISEARFVSNPLNRHRSFDGVLNNDCKAAEKCGRADVRRAVEYDNDDDEMSCEDEGKELEKRSNMGGETYLVDVAEREVMEGIQMGGVEDVQVLAKMQEESLRRHFRIPIGKSQKGNMSTASLNSGRGSSESTSPSESLTNVHCSLGKKTNGNTHQRSMPNLSRSSNLALQPFSSASASAQHGSGRGLSHHKGALQNPSRGEQMARDRHHGRGLLPVDGQGEASVIGRGSLRGVGRGETFQRLDGGLRRPSQRQSPLRDAGFMDDSNKVVTIGGGSKSFSRGKGGVGSGEASGIPVPAMRSGIPRPASNSKLSKLCVAPTSLSREGSLRNTGSTAENNSNWQEGCF